MSKQKRLSIGLDSDSLSPRRVALSLTLAALTAVLPNLAPIAAAQTGRPLIKVVATGGTVANTPDGRISVERIIAELPEVESIADLRVEDVSRLGSSELTFQELIDTAKTIERTFAEEPEVDAIVVTHGSNTSEETAYFLHLLIDSDKPIVVTAAQRQRTTRSEDSSRNFIDAVITASSPNARGKGVLLVVNELIHSARDVTKNVVSRVDSWQSLDVGALGIVSGGEAVFYREPTRRHTTNSEFSLNGITQAGQLPSVEIIYSYIDANPEIIRAAVTEAGADGLVVAGFATGIPHIGQMEALESAAVSGGVPVVIGSRGSSGRLGSRSEPPFVGGDNLSPQKARLLLMFALTATQDRAEIQRIFDEY
jgi:L-asparaginase type II